VRPITSLAAEDRSFELISSDILGMPSWGRPGAAKLRIDLLHLRDGQLCNTVNHIGCHRPHPCLRRQPAGTKRGAGCRGRESTADIVSRAGWQIRMSRDEEGSNRKQAGRRRSTRLMQEAPVLTAATVSEQWASLGKPVFCWWLPQLFVVISLRQNSGRLLRDLRRGWMFSISNSPRSTARTPRCISHHRRALRN